MKLEIRIGERTHAVEITESESLSKIAIDHRLIDADARLVAPGIYSILINGKSFEARVDRLRAALRITVGDQQFVASISDPRKWKKGSGAGHSGSGRQNIIAPMPGRLIRLLVKAGDAVKAGQGVAVVEAMKMQNEIRSPKNGSVEHVLVDEGQTVNAGDTIAVVS